MKRDDYCNLKKFGKSLVFNQRFDLLFSFFEQISFGFKLQIVAHVHNVSSIYFNDKTDRVGGLARWDGLLLIWTHYIFIGIS